MDWIGRVFEDGTGETVEVVSEPRLVSMRGETAVVVRDSSNSEYEVKTEKLESSFYYTER